MKEYQMLSYHLDMILKLLTINKNNMIRKNTKVIDIDDEGYVVMEDTWIYDVDKVYTESGKMIRVLDYKILEVEERSNPHIISYVPKLNKFSCLLLDDIIEIGTNLYLY